MLDEKCVKEKAALTHLLISCLEKDFGVNFKPAQTVESKLFYLRIPSQWHTYRHIRMS